LCAYHDPALGWVGRTERVDGIPPSSEAGRDRLRRMRQSIDLLFRQRATFAACRTYLTCTNSGRPHDDVADS
jgi:hypothetical protein